MNNETSSIIDQNEREYEGLIVSLEANQERLNILICVCDQEKLREEIIDRYSKELEPVIPCYRIDLDQKEPSLRAAIASLVSRKPELLQSKNAVITTTGVEKLHSIEWQQEKSELDKFFGYLQWTREGLREFPYSIVLWVTSTVEVNLRKKSPDFWRRIKGEKVLIFQSDAILLREGIDEFLEYDYIGAPWLKPKENSYVGNGGLSLRTRDVILEISMTNKIKEVIWEDIYFVKCLKGRGVADIETAKRFSMEDVYSPNPLGVHYPIKYIEPELLKKVLFKK
jgi:hypothetical protein